MLNRLGIRGKLLLLCSVLCAFSLVIGVMGIRSLNDVTDKYGHIAEINMPNIQLLEQMQSYYRRSRAMIAPLGIPGVSKEDAEKLIAETRASVVSFEEADKKYQSVPFGPGEQELYDAFAGEWKSFKVLLEAGLKAYQDQDTTRLFDIVIRKMPDANESFGKTIKALVKYHETDAKTSVEAAEASEERADQLSMLLVVAGTLFGMIVGYFFSRALSNTLTQVADRLSSGANDVAAAATQIASTSEELSASSTEQAAALQETAASIEEMSAMISKNTENCDRSKSLSEQSHQSATDGKRIVQDMIRTIEEIHQSSTEMTKEIESNNQEIANIIQVIGEIGEKTKVINDIVFQTKLLSFNASVEAARAGEHGKGFAVVAEEVGNLAQMSGNSAREISSMLQESMAKVETIVNRTKAKVETLVTSSREKVEAGSRVAKQCGEVLDVIVGNVDTVNGTVSEISSASLEQDRGVKEITKAMGQLDQTTQNNSTATEQAAQAAESLSLQANQLRQSVADLMVTVQGAGAVSQTSTSNWTGKGSSSKRAEKSPKVEENKAGKVLKLEKKAKKSEKAVDKPNGVQFAATGSLDSVPSGSDPRFEDV